MKKILILLLIVVTVFTSCGRESVSDEPEISPIQNEIEFPVDFILGNIDVSLTEISESENVIFNDNGTKIKLNNRDGKYILVSYSVKNNESYEIDIDHSVEVFLRNDKAEMYFGEYYENKTGRENIIIKPGKTTDVLFVCDGESEFKYEEIVFRYNQNEYILKK